MLLSPTNAFDLAHLLHKLPCRIAINFPPCNKCALAHPALFSPQPYNFIPIAIMFGSRSFQDYVSLAGCVASAFFMILASSTDLIFCLKNSFMIPSSWVSLATPLKYQAASLVTTVAQVILNSDVC